MSADYNPAAANQFYLQVDGGYALGEQGSGIVDFSGIDVHPGDGTWFSGQFGTLNPSSWDWRIGAGFASLNDGDSDGAGGVDDYGVDSAKMFNLDADLGWATNLGGLDVRPFAGIRYLKWDQDQGYRPDAPLGCCFMDSRFTGIGPHLGFDATMPLGGMLSLVGGADASVLFGEIEFHRGTSGGQVPPANGDDSRTVFGLGGYVGFDVALMQNVSLGAKYRILYLSGSSYDDQGFSDPGGPSGKATNILQGPSASLTVEF